MQAPALAGEQTLVCRFAHQRVAEGVCGFVGLYDDVVRQRYVQLGELVGNLRVITSGLKPDDRVVVGELWRATPGTKVTPQLTTIGG